MHLLLQRGGNKHSFAGNEVLTAVDMNVTIFWDVAQCSPYVNRRFGECIIYIFKIKISRSRNQRAAVR
jgi:hypothetical protein